MPCCEITDCAEMSKTIMAVRHFGLGGRESLETAVTKEQPKLTFNDKKLHTVALLVFLSVHFRQSAVFSQEMNKYKCS